MATKYILNPESGKSIQLGGKKYKELVKAGILENTPFEKTPRGRPAKEKQPMTEKEPFKTRQPTKAKQPMTEKQPTKTKPIAIKRVNNLPFDIKESKQKKTKKTESVDTEEEEGEDLVRRFIEMRTKDRQ